MPETISLRRPCSGQQAGCAVGACTAGTTYGFHSTTSLYLLFHLFLFPFLLSISSPVGISSYLVPRVPTLLAHLDRIFWTPFLRLPPLHPHLLPTPRFSRPLLTLRYLSSERRLHSGLFLHTFY